MMAALFALLVLATIFVSRGEEKAAIVTAIITSILGAAMLIYHTTKQLTIVL